MAHELPGPRPVFTCVQVNPGPAVTPAIAGAQDSASVEASHRLCELSQGRLGTHSPSVDLIAEVGDVVPVRTAIPAFEYGEVSWRVARQGCRGNDSAVDKFDEAGVSDGFSAGCLVYSVVGKKAPRLRTRNVGVCDGATQEESSGSEYVGKHF